MSERQNEDTFKQTPYEGKKAAIYVRVSREETVESPTGEKEARQSIDSQIKEGISICQGKQWQYEVYQADCGKSGKALPGYGANERADLRRLLNDIAAGKIHTVVIRDMARLARNDRLFNEMLYDYFMKYGVSFIATHDVADISTISGRMFIKMLAIMKQGDLEYLSAVSKCSLLDTAIKGKLVQSPNTYGYRSTGHRMVEVVPEEAEVIRRVFKLYVHDGLSFGKIAMRLNVDNVPTKWAGAPWTKYRRWYDVQIRCMIKNTRYIGKLTYHDKVYDSPFPRIIDDDLWQAAQKELEKRSVKSVRAFYSKNLLTGILKCGYCFDKQQTDTFTFLNMVHSTGKSPSNNQVYHYYRCQSNGRHGRKACEGVSIPMDMIEGFVRDFVLSFSIEDFSKLVANEPKVENGLQETLTHLRKELAKNESTISNIPKHIAEASDDDELVSLREGLRIAKTKNKALTAEIAEVENQLGITQNAALVDGYTELQLWDGLEIKQRKKLLKQVIPMIKLFRDRMLMYVGNVNNAPIEIPYAPLSRRGKARVLPALDPNWPVMLNADGKTIGVAVPIVVDGEIKETVRRIFEFTEPEPPKPEPEPEPVQMAKDTNPDKVGGVKAKEKTKAEKP